MANPIKATTESLKGMGVTLKNFFRKPVTVQYPEQVRKLPPRIRGRHVLHRYENGLERCIACMLCSGTCPADAIYIEPAENNPEKPNSFGERYARVFQVDMLRCIFCGYCQAACPTGAITLESNTALATSTRELMLYNKEDMLEPVGSATRGAALAWEPAPPPELKPVIPEFKGVFDGWETTAAAVGRGNLTTDVGEHGAPKPLRKAAPVVPPGEGVPHTLPAAKDQTEEEKA
ncbi:MAG TPA: NADH-quinone oxidoreductase subunit NuoI [Chloroflexia bacterium]|nr:NADH-quinone oxidoreductase subunit NuoI [Chloroflexia bacterium]